MQKIRKRILAMAAAGVMLAAVTFNGAGVPAWAATKTTETRTPISSVTINVTSYIEAGDEDGHIEVTTSDLQYSVGTTEWGTQPTDGWKVGDEPKVKVYLHARSGYYFDKSVNTKKVVVNGATSSGIKKDDNDETLVITVKLGKVKGTLDAPENPEWVGYPLGKASWEKVENANAYELKLYRDNQPIYSVERCTSTTFDFYPYMTQSGTYSYRVRAVPVNSDETNYITSSDWSYSETMDIDGDETAGVRYGDNGKSKPQTPSDVGWVESSDGWRYRLSDGSFVKTDWRMINNKWYFFGYDGYMLTGWQSIGGAYYYFNSNGDMQTGWLEYGRQWYFMNPSDGKMQTGWNISNNNYYYMDPNTGVMQTGWVIVDSKWYYMDPKNSGAMARNTTIGGYYVNGDGVWVH